LPVTVHLIAAARPNFMKVAPLWQAFAARGDRFRVRLIHTGQHYDPNMSDVFFRDLGLPRPDVHLGVGSGSHAEQTATVMIKYEQVCRDERPDLVLVVGDVNSTMAVAITAKKLLVPVGHVEAGLRSRDWTMPEEVNRIVTDVICDHLFTPSRDADANLAAEGVAAERVHFVGNIMIDSLARAIEQARVLEVWRTLGVPAGGYGLVTLHRPANVDDPANLAGMIDAIVSLGVPLVFPVHPRTRKIMETAGLSGPAAARNGLVRLLDPVGYHDFLNLEMNARFIVTDSGGLQEESTWLGVPCLTLRPNTERPITITEGTNELVTLDSLPDAVARIVSGQWKRGRIPELWDGRTAERIVDVLDRRYGPRAG
jgi:UDP-N-acetylglucosamine 2-epimerase (non-hydrolysing)